MNRARIFVSLGIALCCALGISALAEEAVPERNTVGVLVSAYNIRWTSEIGMEGEHWDYLATISNAFDLVRLLGYAVVPILDQDLEWAFVPREEIPEDEFNRLTDLRTIRVLILPLSRRLSPAQVEGIRKFVADGGKIFAMAQTSWRTHNNERWEGGKYGLVDIMGIHFESFAWRPPAQAYIRAVVDHPVFAGLPEFIPVPRNWAMVNSLLEDVAPVVLGAWYNEDKVTPSYMPELSAALIEFDGGIYVGDDLFVPVNFQDPDVQLFLMNVIDYLFGL